LEDLNRNSEDDPYTNHDFDWDTEGNCIAAAAGMSTASGASRYYSSASPAENNWQDYVPDADEHPFVQVEYTPDNTGRIRRQSGVGSDYTIDGEHATEYYYLQPDQTELDRLFGYHVGNAQHYKKNLVVDANGQVSISYIDPQGRVIATALAGDNETGTDATKTNLSSLDEHNTGNHTSVTRDLLNKSPGQLYDDELDNNHRYSTGLQGAAVDGLLFNRQYTSIDDQTHEFEYSVTTSTFSDDCMAEGVSYPFVYDLNIDIKDDCGISLLDYDEDNDTETEDLLGVNTTISGDEGTDFVGASGTTFTINTSQLTADLATGGYSL